MQKIKIEEIHAAVAQLFFKYFRHLVQLVGVVAGELGGEIMIAINEINSWARNTYETYKVFTILGI